MAKGELSQRQNQSQVQVMSQAQIQSLDILSMAGDDLRTAVYKEVQENPALVITKDAAGGNVHLRKGPVETSRLGSSGAAGAQESDRHQAALEACADTRISLQDYLLSQLHVLELSPREMDLGERLIGNLDSRGFHILAPVSLLGKDSAGDGAELLKKLIPLIQKFDPPGCCCKDTEESLLVQARQRRDAPLFALFLLDGHFDFLNPPKPSSIVRKAQGFFVAQSKLFGAQDDSDWEGMEINEAAAEEALSFIRSLDPFPARDYSSNETHYVAPDVYVEAVSDEDVDALSEDFSKGIVVQGGKVWQVRLASGDIPSVAINPSYMKFSGDDKDAVISGGIRRAKEFISALEGRQDTLLRGSCMIVKKQYEFFESGPGHLSAFRQKDVASVLGVHETTVSRMAGSKYLQCHWGLFPLKYFFVNSVGADEAGGGEGTSRDKVKAEIEKILQDYEAKKAGPSDHKKKLSDQKISDILAERGMKVARRTVAKYRAELSLR